MITEDLDIALKPTGLITRGAFHPGDDDDVPAGTRTLVLIGNAGPAMWWSFSENMPDSGHPLDAWTAYILYDIARAFDGRPVYPFSGPPYFPFQRWAMKADDVSASPIGPLIHPVYGMWHAYRGAILFQDELKITAPQRSPSPCESCVNKPCLTTCPVNAFTEDRYDVPACREHIAAAAGKACLDEGCLARRACPVGQDYIYEPAQAQFHMEHFLYAR